MFTGRDSSGRYRRNVRRRRGLPKFPPVKLSVVDENWGSTAYTNFSSSGHKEGDEHPENLSEVTLVYHFHLPDILQGLSVSGQRSALISA